MDFIAFLPTRPQRDKPPLFRTGGSVNRFSTLSGTENYLKFCAKEKIFQVTGDY